MTSMTPKTQVGVWGEVPPAGFVLKINGVLARPWAPFPKFSRNFKTLFPALVARAVYSFARRSFPVAAIRVNQSKNFAGHQTVRLRCKEYVRGEAYTNTLEGYFSISREA